MKTLAFLGFFNSEAADFVANIRKTIGLEKENIHDIPHITFAITGNLPFERAETFSHKLLDAHSLLLLEFSSIGYFPESGTFFLGVTSSVELLRFHNEIVTFITDGGYSISPHYLPGRWVPHCSIVSGDTGKFFNDQALKKTTLPYPARIEKLSVTELDHTLGEMTHRVDLSQNIDPDDN